MRLRLAQLAIVLLAIALLIQQGFALAADWQATASSAVPAVPLFADVSWQAGIVDNRVASNEMTAGQAWGDYDNDGWVDLYVTDSSGANTLYHNQGDGTFQVSSLAGQVALRDAYSFGATFVDYDNDGWRDLYVTNWGADVLFRNDGGERFIDITAKAGIRENANSKTASWGDYDQDGFLDLYIANWSCYPKCGRPMDGESDLLHRNNGDGTFSNVSDLLGGSLNGAGFVASFTDYDNDGDLDIYLVNDEFVNPIGNKLWRNDGPGCQGWCFTQVAQEAGADSKLFGMGLAVGDYDNDGDQDFYFSNVGPMELLNNQGDGTFQEVAEQAGVQFPNAIGWGAVFLDYDNDGWRDLYLAVADTANHKDIAANPLFHNNGDGTFSLVDCNNESADVRMSISVAYADYDRDGWVDLVVGNADEGYRLYRNQVAQSDQSLAANHWLAFELVGAGPVNRDAVGARVYVSTSDGNSQMQEVINGASVGAGNELALYFGLGQAQQANVTVRWSDGRQQAFQNVAADTRYRLEYPLHTATLLQPLSQPQQVAKPAPSVPQVKIPPGLWLAGAAVLLVMASALVQFRRVAASQGAAWALTALSVAFFVGALALTPEFADLPGMISGDRDARLRRLLKEAEVYAPTNPPPASPALLRLGEALFWDPELSGNRDTTCATCHHPTLATGDNLSVPIGTGGRGLGEQRQMGTARELVARNAPPVFNLGYTEWTVFFWDGRVFGTPETGFHSPASDRLPEGLDNLLAVQAMFPVTSRDEMRGNRGDRDIFGAPNELAMIPDYTVSKVWRALMARLLSIPGYVELFQAAYPEIPPEKLGFQHAANAMSAYQATVFTFEDSPFDRYLRGESAALSEQQKQGALLFFGEAGCADCHSGPLLTDQRFYNLAVPQVGPGKGREQPLDLGRARETGLACDRFAFRTPPLRNVAITGPWMHNGAFTTLEAAVRHHLAPLDSLQKYDPSQLAENLEDTCQDQPQVLEAIKRTYTPIRSQGVYLSEVEIQALLAFLEALTSPSALNLEHTIPVSVPSGLKVGGN